MITELQKKAAQTIVNIFETGTAHGDYGKVTVVPGDSGHLTYGRSQTTLTSGNLHLLVKAYSEAPGAALAVSLEPFLSRLLQRDLALDGDLALRGLLKEAGEDPVMQDVQDRFFDRVYWEPAVKSAELAGITTGLGSAVVYDSKVHGSWPLIRDRTTSQHGGAREVGEKVWVDHYVQERRGWLANHQRVLLRKTVYRMDSFRQLITAEKWDLSTPFRVRGVLIDEEVLVGAPTRVSAEDEQDRTLQLQMPFMIGADVEALQQALTAAGLSVRADGVFGPLTDAAVRRFQQKHGLKVDGIAGPATRAALGL